MKKKFLVVITFLIFLYGCSTTNSKNDSTISNMDIQYDMGNCTLIKSY